MKRALIALYNWGLDIYDFLVTVGILLLVIPYAIWQLIWEGLKWAFYQLSGSTAPQPEPEEEPTIQDYIQMFKDAVPDVLIKEPVTLKGNTVKYVLVSRAHNSLPVYLKQSHKYDLISIEIPGTDCGYWHTGEDQDLSGYVDAGIAALQGKWTKRFGLHGWEMCFRLPNGRWMVTRTEGEHRSHYVTIRRWV